MKLKNCLYSKTDKKYHLENCRTLRGKKEAIDLNEAIKMGMRLVIFVNLIVFEILVYIYSYIFNINYNNKYTS